MAEAFANWLAPDLKNQKDDAESRAAEAREEKDRLAAEKARLQREKEDADKRLREEQVKRRYDLKQMEDKTKNLEAALAEENERKKREEEEREEKRRATPWRKLSNMQWRETDLKTLLTDMTSYAPRSEEVGAVRIMLCGQISAGKSSCINTFKNALTQTISFDAYTEEKDHSVTTQMKTYTFKSEVIDGKATDLNFEIIDTMGVEYSSGGKSGLLMDDIEKILDGHVKDGYTFNPIKGINEESSFYEKSPSVREKIHVVAVVVDGSSLEAMDPSSLKTLNEIKDKAVKRNIQWALILTKVDKISEHLVDNVENVYKDDGVKTVLETSNGKFGINEANVLPIKCYKEEVQNQVDKDILALTTLKQLLALADSTLRNQTTAKANPRPLAPSPWHCDRGNFDRSEKETLKQKIIEFEVDEPISILLLGAHNAGKSSFINTIQSTFFGTFSNKAVVQSDQKEVITQVFSQFKIRTARKQKDGVNLKIKLFDTMGFMETDGLQKQDAIKMLEGNVPKGFQTSTQHPIEESNAKLHKNGENTPHIVAIVVDAVDVKTLKTTKPVITTYLKDLIKKANLKRQGVVVLLTHIDKVCEHVAGDVANTFKSTDIKETIKGCSQELGVLQNCIFPIKNYESETSTQDAIDVLALNALYEMMLKGDEIIEDAKDNESDEDPEVVDW